MPLMPISPPSQVCLRTKPTNRKFDADRGHGEEVAAHAQRREPDDDSE